MLANNLFNLNYVSLVTKIPAEELMDLFNKGEVSGVKKKERILLEASSIRKLLESENKYVADVFKTDKKFVLIVDDDILITKSLKRLILHYEDVLTGTASNGFEMGKALNTRIPDIVILDFNMPGINGYEILTLLKEYHDAQDMKILVYSSAVPEELLPAMYELGVDEIITKSADNEKLREKLEQYLN